MVDFKSPTGFCWLCLAVVMGLPVKLRARVGFGWLFCYVCRVLMCRQHEKIVMCVSLGAVLNMYSETESVGDVLCFCTKGKHRVLYHRRQYFSPTVPRREGNRVTNAIFFGPSTKSHSRDSPGNFCVSQGFRVSRYSQMPVRSQIHNADDLGSKPPSGPALG